MKTVSAIARIGVFSAIILLFGCATFGLRFNVAIDSISLDSGAPKKTYVLLPGNKGVSADDLQFREFATYVARALDSKGFVRASNTKKAEIVVFVSYGIGNPEQHIYSYSVAHYGETGISSATTIGNTTYFQPSYGVTGYTSGVGSHTTFDRYMILDAYDVDAFEKNKRLIEIWKTTTTSTGTSDDLRRVFPIMVAGAQPYLASNTGQKVRVVLSENNSAVKQIKSTFDVSETKH